MHDIIIKNAEYIVTMAGEPIRDGAMAVTNGQITYIGKTEAAPQNANRVINAHHCVVTPGFINTHHHLYQNLTRAVAPNDYLFGWLKTLYPIWGQFTPDDFRHAVAFGMAQLALSGCTMTSDHHYIFPNGAGLQDDIDGAKMIGTRLLATYGSMSIGESKGGLPPDNAVLPEDKILELSEHYINRLHNPNPGAMVQIGLAPCSPFSVSQQLMKDSAQLARQHGVRLHTHLAENAEDIAYSEATFGCRPGQYAEQCGWLGPDVWHAHCVQLNPAEIKLFAKTHTGVAHCPCSNMRLGSGIAPIRAMVNAGVPVGLGVDGSASNDNANMIEEMRMAMLLQRVQGGAGAFSVMDSLQLATTGGARVLGRADLGSLEVGKRADFNIFNGRSWQYSGAFDLVSALLLCGVNNPESVFCEGRQIVGDYQLLTADMHQIHAMHQLSAKKIRERVGL